MEGAMFLLNVQSKIPIHEQIRNQILRYIEAGVLSPGDRLPSVRQLAAENGINPNTAARAYAQLEACGAVYNIPKKGVYVKERTLKKEPGDSITAILQKWKKEGVTEQELQEKIAAVYREV